MGTVRQSWTLLLLLTFVVLIGPAGAAMVSAQFSSSEAPEAVEAGIASVAELTPTVAPSSSLAETPVTSEVLSMLSAVTPTTAFADVTPTPDVEQSLAADPALALSMAAVAGSVEGLESGRLVDIGGRSLFLRCVGVGTPAVIFDAGLSSAGASSNAWDPVFNEVAKTTRACTYDRANLGKSDQGKRPRTSKDNVEDLHALLAAARIPGPYVLVGHSFGGFQVRLYAYTYPQEVVGLVLVDAVQENWYLNPGAVLTPEQQKVFWIGRADNPAGADLPASAAQVQRASRQLDIPLVVVTRGQTLQWPPTFPVERIERVWQDQQAELIKCSKRGRQVIATRSGHSVQHDEPGVVIAAVRQVLNDVQAH